MKKGTLRQRVAEMKYRVNSRCTKCGDCFYVCHVGAISETPEGVKIIESRCVGCEECRDVCGENAIEEIMETAREDGNE